MNSNYLVMLIAPVEEERVSMVALQLADVLNVSITKLSRLLSGRPGPLTKAIPRETANKLAKVMEQLDIQIAVVPENLEETLLFPNKKKDNDTESSQVSNASSQKENPATQNLPSLDGGIQAIDLDTRTVVIPSKQIDEFIEEAKQQTAPRPVAQTSNLDSPVTNTASSTVFADTEVSFAEPPSRSAFSLPFMLLALAVLTLAIVLGANYVIPQAKGTENPTTLISDSSSDSSATLSNLLSSAEAGDSEAQFELAWAYANGINTEQSYEQAASWLQASSDQGNAKAQYYLGLYYYFGHGLEQNPVAAFNWFRNSALQGLPEAQYMLGRMYLNGDGVTANQDEALKWLYLADEKGVAEAGLLINGNGVLASPKVQNHPLFDYAKEGNLEAIRAEVSQGSSLNVRDPFGQTPLMYAVSAGELNSLLGLIELGADVNAQSSTGWTALMFAARDNAQAITLLLEHDARADLVNNEGQRAYDIALVNHPEALISLQAASSSPIDN